ncbi:hypothetical protein CRYUN_Cryun01aG0069500 [Craigia yunnanensis]
MSDLDWLKSICTIRTLVFLSPDAKHPFVDLSGRKFRIGKVHGKKVIYVRCGVGMVNAAAVTQQMLDLFNVDGIIHFGIAGNANDSMSIGDVSIPCQVAHTGIWDWVNPQGTVDEDDVAQLDIGSYNVPKVSRTNLLGHIGYRVETRVVCKFKLVLTRTAQVSCWSRGLDSKHFCGQCSIQGLSFSNFSHFVSGYGECSSSNDKLVKWLPCDCDLRALRFSWKTTRRECNWEIWVSCSSKYSQSCSGIYWQTTRICSLIPIGHLNLSSEIL